MRKLTVTTSETAGLVLTWAEGVYQTTKGKVSA